MPKAWVFSSKPDAYEHDAYSPCLGLSPPLADCSGSDTQEMRPVQQMSSQEAVNKMDFS